MAYILDIATAVPEYALEKDEFVDFYLTALGELGDQGIKKKINLFNERTKIQKRYSCIPDFGRKNYELFTNQEYAVSIENRIAIYKDKILPLASKAIDKLLLQTKVKNQEITHLISVSCTGLFAPGFEFLVSEKYGLQNTEKLAINFLGCYAALKALKHAHYIANADPNACILLISAELCSLHFLPSTKEEDIIANLLFADGASSPTILFVLNKLLNKIKEGEDSASKTIFSCAFGPGLSLEMISFSSNNMAYKNQ